MTTYKELYFHLFNALEDGHTITAIHLPQSTQQQAEELYMESDILPDAPAEK